MIPGRKTLGLYLTSFSDRYQAAVWAGIYEEAAKYDINLICVRGERQNSPDLYERSANILYEITGSANLEGLIILSNAVGTFCSPEELKEYFQRYKRIPVVSAGYKIEGTPGIYFDNDPGMTTLVRHMVRDHQYKKFLFISGPKSHRESEIRYKAFLTVLQEAGLSPDDQLYAQGDFSQEAGNLGVLQFSREELENVDAVISANDSMAFGAMEELLNMGFRIPQDIAVTGFDDTEDCHYSIPTLTTVRQPHVREGKEAMRMLMEVMNGAEGEKNIELTADLIIRESCGCLNRFLKKIPDHSSPGEKPKSLVEAEKMIKRKKNLRFLDAIPLFSRFIREVLEKIEEAARQKDAETFFSFWQERLGQKNFPRTVLRGINDFMGELLFSLSSYIIVEKDILFISSLLYQSREYLMELESRKRAREHLEYEKMFQALETISTRLMSTLEETDLKMILTDCMINLKIPGFYLVLYEKPGEVFSPWSRLIYYFKDSVGFNLGEKGIRFRTTDLLPLPLLEKEKKFIYIMEALYIQEQQIGYIITEMGPRYGEIYDTLRLKLSTAVHSLDLISKVRDHARKLEQEVAERTADLVRSNEELLYQINQRRKADAARVESEQTLRSITEAIPVPLFIMNRENFRIIYKNRPFISLFGDTSVFFPLNSREESSRFIPGSHERELKLYDYKGKPLWMIAESRNIIFKGEDAVIVGLNDISETKQLQKKILEISEGTQRRIGLDLHDETCQNLAGISIMTTVVSNKLKEIDDKLFHQVKEIEKLINGCIGEIANIARGLYPADLESNGLAFAVLQITKHVERQFNKPCAVKIDEDVAIKNKERQLHFFRICQELIYNAFKHSKGDNISVTLSSSGETVTCKVEDNGKGFVPQKRKSDRMGLLSIMYRAQLIDGELSFIPRQGGGTIAQCIIKEVNHD